MNADGADELDLEVGHAGEEPLPLQGLPRLPPQRAGEEALLRVVVQAADPGSLQALELAPDVGRAAHGVHLDVGQVYTRTTRDRLDRGSVTLTLDQEHDPWIHHQSILTRHRSGGRVKTP